MEPTHLRRGGESLTQEYIREIKRGALSWIVKNIHYFDMNHKVANDFRWRLKTFIELIFLTNYLIRNQADDKEVAVLTEFITERLRNDQLEEFIHFDPDGLAGLAIAGEFLTLTDHPSRASVIWELEKFTAARFDCSLAKVPFRKMDLKYSLQRAGVTSEITDFSDLYHYTAAGQDIPNTYMTDHDAYSITHTIFYITDMGCSSLTDKEYHLPSLKEKVLKFLGIYICLENLDITSELLMCSSFLHINMDKDNHKPLYEAAWNKIYQGRMKEGNVPSITYHHKPGLTGEQRREDVFKHCYHTTLVAAGAAHACLRAERND